MPGNSALLMQTAGLRGQPVAFAQQRGRAWIVTVSYPRSGNAGARYEVHRRAGTYCVYRQLDAS